MFTNNKKIIIVAVQVSIKKSYTESLPILTAAVQHCVGGRALVHPYGSGSLAHEAKHF